MNHFIKTQELKIKSALEKLGYKVENISLIESSKKELGDYQFNGIMPLAKKNQQNPVEIANKVVDILGNDHTFKEVNVAGPGFINIRFSEDSMMNYLNEINHDFTVHHGEKEDKTIVIDYGGPNVAKALHVGHLRSANIGEALNRLAKSQGIKTIGDVHLGDWGRPLGLVILEIKKRFPNLNYFDESYQGEYEELPINNEDLIEIYPYASNKAKEDESYLEEARILTFELQQKKPGIYDLWKKIIEISVTDIKETYNRLDVHFDLWYGESDANNYQAEVLKILEEQNLLYISEGALVIDVQEAEDTLEIPPFMVKNSNGGLTYQVTDLFTIYQRVKEFNPDEIWYVVDNRQALHFKQVFRVAKKAGIVREDVKLEFLGFGTMNGSDGKPFKTRDGGVMSLNVLIDTVNVETTKRLNPNIEENEREAISEKIAISALKYADLIPNRTTDYIFDSVKFSDLSGKTGPYLLYSTIRMKSLLTRASEQNIRFELINEIDDQIKEVALNVLKMPVVLETALKNKSLSDITEYIYVLTSVYNNFYASNKVLIEENESKRESWLVITKIVYTINSYLLNILGLQVPDKM